MSTALNISNNWLSHTASHFLPKVFHDGSAKFTTRNFECMVCLKKFTLKKSWVKEKIIMGLESHVDVVRIEIYPTTPTWDGLTKYLRRNELAKVSK